MKVHPLADMFPSMPNEQYMELVASIRENGLREPIMLFGGQILDGKHRETACNQAQVEPHYETFNGTEEEALVYVVDLNLRRRHLDESQRAMVAANLAGLSHGQRADTQICATTQPEAARTLNVSARSVQDARKVQKKGDPELVKAVEQGKIKVSAAAKMTNLRPKDQRQVAASKNPVQEAKKIGRVKKAATEDSTQKQLESLQRAWRPL